MLTFIVGTSVAQTKVDDLQKFIDSLSEGNRSRATAEITDIDLSTFGMTKRSTPLNIAGQRIRFINGTLTATDTYDGAILNISGNGYVEIANGATIQCGPKTYSYRGLVTMQDGTIIVSGGDLLPNDPNYHYSALIETKSGSTVGNTIEIKSGQVNGYVYSDHSGDKITVTGGQVYGFHAWNRRASFEFSGEANINNFSSMPEDVNVIPLFTSALKYPITFQKRTSFDENIAEYSIVAQAANGYEFTASDLDKMSFIRSKTDPTECELVLENNRIAVREKINLSTADDLQAYIDRLAKNGTTSTTNPATIEIPAAGITLDKPITIPSKCHITLTGGTITVGEGIQESADFVFFLNEYATLKFENITYDGNNQYHHGKNSFMINPDSNLHFGKNVTVKNLCPDGKDYGYFVYAYAGNVTVESGTFELGIPFVYSIKATNVNIKGGVIHLFAINSAWAAIDGSCDVNMSGGSILYDHNKIAINIQGSFHMSGGYIKTPGEVIDASTGASYNGGEIEGMCTTCAKYIDGNPQFKVDYLRLYSPSISGSVNYPLLQLLPTSQVKITSAILYDWKVRCAWNNLELEKAFFIGSGYTLTEADFKRMTFVNMPSDREAYYDEADHSVKLREKKTISNADDLQAFIDSLTANGDKGTEESPKEITPADGGLDIDKDVNIDDDLQAFIDGLTTDGKDSKEMRMCGGNIIIKRGSCLRLKNLHINGCDGDNHIYVNGTLIIDINVYITRFKSTFIHVAPGGKVVWEGGTAGCAPEVIYNEGGTVELKGGHIESDSYGIINIKGTVHVWEGTFICGSNGAILNGSESSTDAWIYINGGDIKGCIINYGGLEMTEGSIDGGPTNPGVKNYGSLIIKGGSITGQGGAQSIWTTTVIYLCGCTDLNGDIYLYGHGKVYITESMRIIFRIRVFIDGLAEGYIIVAGSNGYELSTTDAGFFDLILPEGFRWSYDSGVKAITVDKSSGIDDIFTDGSEGGVHNVYTLGGVLIGTTDDISTLPAGIYIINGKKVSVK